jgi:hypothetical protein
MYPDTSNVKWAVWRWPYLGECTPPAIVRARSLGFRAPDRLIFGGSFVMVSRWTRAREEPLWHICGTQAPKRIGRSINEPVGTTHEFGNSGQRERVLIAL